MAGCGRARHDGNRLAPGALGTQPAAHLPPPRARSVTQGVVENGYALVFSVLSPKSSRAARPGGAADMKAGAPVNTHRIVDDNANTLVEAGPAGVGGWRVQRSFPADDLLSSILAVGCGIGCGCW